MIKIGDIVIGKHDYTFTNGTRVFTAGSRFMVNDFRQIKCNCTSNNVWDYAWLGHYASTDINFTCSKCNKINIRDSKVWINKAFWELVNPNTLFSTKYGMQIQLMRLLIDKGITPEAYNKIIGMTEGDDELLELGRLLISKIETKEI